MSSASKLIVSGLLAVFLVSCSLTPVKSPSVNQFTIEPVSLTKSQQTPQTKNVLMVSQPKAEPGYKSQSMLYKTRSHELAAYQQNQWASAPAVMLQSVLAMRIKQRHYFKYVAEAPYVGNYNYRLQTQLMRLYQSFRDKTSQIHLTLSAQVINNATNRVLASQTFDVTHSAPANDPYSGVVATNQSADVLAKQVAKFVVNTVEQDRQQSD